MNGVTRRLDAFSIRLRSVFFVVAVAACKKVMRLNSRIGPGLKAVYRNPRVGCLNHLVIALYYRHFGWGDLLSRLHCVLSLHQEQNRRRHNNKR